MNQLNNFIPIIHDTNEEPNVMLLDCTLRDGGYVNNWNWGHDRAKSIIRSLIKSHIDVVEVGFLRNIPFFDPDVTVANTIEELNTFIPDSTGKTIFSGMAMRSNYDIKKLSPYSGKGIEMIRITAHDYDLKEGMAFAREVKDRGYKLSINPINIMGYSDDKVLWIIDEVNRIEPYQFSIVDTFGSMKRRDLDRIVSLVDHNLDKEIRLSLHLHENMSLSTLLAQQFVDKRINRKIAIDGSLMGMGRIPGNLPIELIADYTNEYLNKIYDIDFMMDAINEHIEPLKGESNWGYTPAYFLSAHYNLHRNYAEHYLKKGDLTTKDINHILSRIDLYKKTVFDKDYADLLYRNYQDHQIDDSLAIDNLSSELSNKDILVVAPGSSLNDYNKQIKHFISEKKPKVIAINFIPKSISCNYAFFSNNKRLEEESSSNTDLIITSNLIGSSNANRAVYVLDYNSLSKAFTLGCNSFIMILSLLKRLTVNNIYVCGADGYVKDSPNYFSNKYRTSDLRGNDFNIAVKEAIRKLNINVEFITPSAYK
ncbi:aldolase catalytic domain-containing protein [Succinivibrio dextrinosolvens]|uniref:4-hydroxy 2-oxovalerate aldolase n=1 Tax=Succinivibrio dextrinosolvens TaxID=83771 RepID=A0A662ZED1_9GAMM|nr:aldolase catalytic domain-containing protein [Succinivibrio dextrinosolvens]SFK45016.1 4-hydroxy 2-oxovalerate aldolase [Succinivibrio dextrinosolvens]